MLGARVVQRLVAQGTPVVALTRSALSSEHPFHKLPVRLYTLDLATAREDDIEKLFAEVRPSALIHSAALTGVDLCDEQRELVWAVNTDATGRLARACARHHAYCLFVSTDYVFDGTQAAGSLYREDDPVHPLNLYGYSKWQGELAVQAACEGVTGWSICRTSVVYGAAPWSRLDFVQWLAHRLGEGKQVQIVNDQVSSPTEAIDLAQTLTTLTLGGHTGIYHTAGSSALDRYSFARLIARTLALDEGLIVPISTQKLNQAVPRPLNAGLNVERVSAVLGRRPASAAEGIARHWSPVGYADTREATAVLAGRAAR